ncbi:hypothetical protein UZ36_07205 [Candidatus Nitromaritima sp. SCGC AAA799-C22]|nr:hypothetical protein UZ36_07205 [Candidatus Nitromaritima sp. SCGC AAA799-C22]
MQTIVDILRKGNQELFHSEMIAWLLDPNAGHGLNAQFLEGFASKLETLDKHGSKKLKMAISTDLPVIKTETSSFKRRHDIEIGVQDKLFVIENKTKSIGGFPQFRKYDQGDVNLIALGFSDISFSEDVKNTYPLITYREILEILESVEFDPKNEFTVLVKHYRAFLKREIALLEMIVDVYENGEMDAHNKISSQVSDAKIYGLNDIRFQ